MENVVVSGDLIFVLVREERKASWFSVAKTVAARFFSPRAVPQIIENRRINVLRIDRKSRNIQLIETVKEEQILSELNNRFPEMNL